MGPGGVDFPADGQTHRPSPCRPGPVRECAHPQPPSRGAPSCLFLCEVPRPYPIPLCLAFAFLAEYVVTKHLCVRAHAHVCLIHIGDVVRHSISLFSPGKLRFQNLCTSQ